MDQRRAAAALLALAACIACSAAAPTANSNHTALELHNGPVEGCYYNFQHYGEGDRIMTNEPCLNCTCHNRMLMCYLRVCPFTKAIGQDCTVEKRADQCCPIVTCPDVPVDLLTSTSTSSPAEYGTTGLGKLDKYGCSIHGKYFPEGSKVPPTPNKPCEHCYCIRNMTTCVMQECTLHVDGCTPIYHKDVCCPVRYSCDHPEDEIPLLDDMTTTVRPTPGFLLTTTTILPVTQMSQDCVHDDQIFPDGALIKTEKACEHCYCMKGDIVCVVQECGTPMENEGKNCTSLPPRQGQCCPDTYICEGDERITESTTETEELTTSPPRRAGVEGSGYRNEPDELYTETTPVLTETEGSGDLFTTIPEIDTVENITPQKVSPEIVDETLLTTTETSLQFSQSTEPDKGQNTIPDSISDKETTHIPVQDKVTLPGLDKINDFDHTISGDQSQKDDIITTEKGGDTVHDESSTPKEYEKVTTDSTEFLGKTTVMSEDITQTSKSEVIEIIEQDQKTTMPTTDTQKSQESSQPEIITDTVTQSSVTESHKLVDDFRTTTEPQISNDLTSTPEIKVVGLESTSVNPTVNEIDDHITPISSPSRIPGEGDCLLNGITYTNNTSVPNRNNCHTGCKCVSSIIKCDPIICSPPPEYMENVNDCQPVYDTPDSCCPTYVCSVKETVPPESHSQMSGTESPKPVEASECSGSDCVVGEDKKTVVEPTTICTSGDCLDKTPETHQECTSNDCQDHKQTKPVDCSGGQCEMLPVLPCEGENCKIDPTKEIIPEKDLDTSSQSLPTEDNIVGQEECAGDNCVKKEFSEIGEKSECSTSDCKLHDEPTMAPVDKQTIEINTEKVFVEKSTPSTVTDMNAPKTESIESLEHLTTSKLNEEESDKDVTKQLETYTESSEKLTTIHEENITDPPKDHDTEIDSNQTDSPIIQTPTELSQEAEILPTEKPKPSDIDASSENEFIKTVTPSLQETYTMTTAIDVAQTEPETHFETKTETSLIEENEEFTTKKPHVFDSNVHETVSDEIYTTIPQVMSSEAPTKQEGPVTTENEGYTTKKPFDFDSDVQQTISDEIHTKTPSATTDAPESLVTEKKEESSEVVTEKEDTVTQPSEILVTKKEEEGIIYDTPEIVTEKKEIETIAPEIFTEKEEIVTQSPTMIIDEENIVTEKIVTEKEEDKLTPESPKIVPEEEEAKTMAPDVLVTTKKEQKDEMQSESPEVVTEKVEIDTELPEILYTTQGTIYSEATEQLYTAMEGAQTSISDITAAEKKTTQSEILELATEKVVMESNIPDIIATVVTEAFTEKEDIVTKVPDEIYVEKEDIPTKTSEITATETDTVQTEIPDIVKEERISTIAPDVLDPEKQTAFIENTGTTDKIIKLETLVPVTEAEVIQTEAPILIDSESERIKTMSPEMVTEKENVQTDSPDIKLEETTKHESDKTLVEEQTKTSISSGIDENESAYVTEESLIKHPVTLPEVSTEEKLYDDKGTKPENTITEDITLSGYTERSEIYTPHETVTYKTVTDHLTVEDKTETSTKESQLLITEELEQITKLPQDFVTKSEDDAPTTTYDLHYTSSSDKLGTKSDDIPHGVDHSVTESQATAEQENLASQDAETSTEYGPTFTHEYIESSGVDKESSSLPTNNVKEKEDKYTEYPEMYSTISQISDKSTKQPELYVSPTGEIATTEKFTEIQQTSTMTDSEKQFDDEEHRIVTDEIQQTTVGNVIELTTLGKVITEKEVISTDSPQQQTVIDHKQDSDYPLLPTTLQDGDKKLETATDTADFVTEVTKTQSVYDIEKEQELTTNIPDKDLTIETIYTDKETTQSPYKLSESTGQQQAVSQQTNKVDEDTTEYNVETTTKLRDEKEDEKEERVPEIITQKDNENEEPQEKETTTIPQTTQSSNINKLESTPTFTVTSETEIVTEKDTDGLKYTVKDEEQDKPYDIEKEVLKPSSADDKSSETTDGTGLQEAYSPDHIAFDKSTTQLPTQISEEISTVKVIPSLDDTNLNAEHEINTKVPDSIATFEESTSHIKDKEITTESYTYNTISEDKDTVSTSIGEDKEIQKEHTPDSEKYLTTSSSFQPQDYTRITEQPLSLVTNIDHAEPSHTTVSQKEPVTELESIPDEHKMEEEKKQTILPDIYVTESQKLSTEAPKEYSTVQEQGSESSSEINEEDSNTMVTHSAQTLIDEHYLTDHRTTAISIEQTDTSLDGTSISNIELQKTEGTPSSVIEEGLTYQQKTTTVSLPITETQPSHSHEQEIPPENAIDELATKLPYEGSTIFDEVTNMPTTFEIDHEKEIKTTAAAFVEGQVVTLYPEVHDQQTITPEKETSESQGLEDSKTSKPLTEKELISTPMPIETDISVNLITEVTTQPDKETTTSVEVVTEKEVIFAENKPLSETTGTEEPQEKESITESSDRLTTIPGTLSSTSDLPKDDEHQDDDILSQGTTHIPELSTLLIEDQTDSTDIEKITAMEEIQKPTEKAEEIQPETYSTQPVIEKETFTTESAGHLNLETEKILTSSGVNTELPPTTLASSNVDVQFTQAHKEFDESKLTTEQQSDFSETTPFLVELEHHTHQVIEESSRAPVEEFITPVYNEPQQTERGDQNLEVTSKYEDEYITSVPVKETDSEYEDKEKHLNHTQDQIGQKVPSATTITVKDITEILSNTEIIPTVSSTYSDTDGHELEKQTTIVQNAILSTSAPLPTIREQESETSTSRDIPKLTYPIVEPSSISTEKDIYSGTEEPMKSETIASDEGLVQETSKATTSKIIEETSTLSSPIEKSPQPEEKPIVTTLSPIQEVSKPGFDDEINEGVPHPDFPPSGGYGQEPDYIEEDQAFGPGTCRYGGKVYVSAQQIPRDDPCDFCFCFRSDIICLQQSCPPPIHGCHEEPIQGFCCPRYECPVSMATTVNVTTTTTTTTTTLPPHFFPHAYKGAAQRRGCQIKGHSYKVGEVVRASSGPCLHCTCGGDGQMKCDPKACTPEPMLRQMIAAAVSAKRRR